MTMRTRRMAIQVGCIAVTLVVAGCDKNNGVTSPSGVTPSSVTAPSTTTPSAAPPAPAATPGPIVYSNGDAVRGGALYDQWWVINGGMAPTTTHPAYPASGQQSGAGTWRCKECHGWDYRGVAGAYGTGSHSTGIGGVLAAKAKPQQTVWNSIKHGGNHNFSAVLSDDDICDLLEFIRVGTFNMNSVIDFASKQARGNVASGQALWFGAGRCSQCHGADGRQNAADVPGDATGNPWEVLHKIRWGHPGSDMPSAVQSGLSLVEQVDILAFAQSLDN